MTDVNEFNLPYNQKKHVYERLVQDYRVIHGGNGPAPSRTTSVLLGKHTVTLPKCVKNIALLNAGTVNECIRLWLQPVQSLVWPKRLN